jgi:hypothetical protein
VCYFSTTTTIKSLIPDKLGYARNKIQSENINIWDLKYKKSIDNNSENDANNNDEEDDNNNNKNNNDDDNMIILVVLTII